MVFSEAIFLFYFLPVVLGIYFIADRNYKNFILLTASIVFYSFGAPKFVFIMFITTCIDFYLVKQLDKRHHSGQRKILLAISVIINVSVLFYFKYCNFFIDNINSITHALGFKNISHLDIILPIGVSFYTFESITYMVDVYRKVHKPLDSLVKYQTYIFLFPKLIAGPIVRFHEIADQFDNRVSTIDDKLIGLYRFIIGLSKKLLIADYLSTYTIGVFDGDINLFHTSAIWFGLFSYSIQLYFDFSGYSDMAIGLARMFGFKIPENFNQPFISKNITEFWTRWHISLSNWFRNYLYIPLGGNRKGIRYTIINLAIIFLLSGFWHGASWNFLLFGVYHGFFIIIGKLGLDKISSKAPYLFIPLTFLTYMFSCILFRIDDIAQAQLFIYKLFHFQEGWTVDLNPKLVFILAIAIMTSIVSINKYGEKLVSEVFTLEYNLKKHLILFIISILLIQLCIMKLSADASTIFIYFQF